MQGRRVAVTGLGVVAQCGVGREAFFEGLCAPAPEGPRILEDFDPASAFENPKEARRADRFTQFALTAADEALAQAGELDADPARRGTFVGTGVGGIQTLEDQITTRIEKGERRVSPFLVPMIMANAAPAAISMKYGWQGPCENTVTACAAGTHAIGNAARMIADGRCDAVIAGGSEAPFTPTAVAGFRNMTALSNSGVSRPFDVDRDGFVMAEGAGILVLEEWDRAVARGATILGEILGSASTADAHHITAPAPGGTGAINCMQLAMEDAGISASDVVHINAHGTSTDKNDAAEAAAVAKVFGTPGPAITSTKGVTGHALGGAGALEAVAVILAMQKGVIPPTAGHNALDPEMPEIDVVTGEPRPWTPGATLSNSFGFGGHNGTLVLGPA
ncbi:MAG: beta-ketoacyl-ACP synthase II [Acidimicrobiales bacterium]|jgi:3-oxoacyl-[acyl-carrier-protein] synthase II|nr:beta-ketoacyl-ACP synthase II [Acidimicrobiales bacterium]